MKLNKNEVSYWIGFFMCLFILGVSFEIINQFERHLTIEIMHELYNSFLVWSPIFMIGIAIIGMFIIIRFNKDEVEVKNK
jgi:hypothetical protein